MKIKLVLLLCCYISCIYGQMRGYNYQMKLTGIKDPWHNVILPDEIFGKLKPNLSDIRIFGITTDKDTIEVPYILHRVSDKISETELKFDLINPSHNEKGYFYTLETAQNKTINEMHLFFNQNNFDWKVDIEGSQDQKEWFSVINNYRILSIKNNNTDFQFTSIYFPPAKYRYFRIRIDTDKSPELLGVKAGLRENIDGIYRSYVIKNYQVKEDADTKRTELDITLKTKVPVSYLRFFIRNKFDFYRPVTIKYIADSTKTQTGYVYKHVTLFQGVLNSLHENEFSFTSVTLDKLKIFIENSDNPSLRFDSVIVRGYEHQLIARFDNIADYFLVYGNSDGVLPDYDINRFTHNVPTVMSTLTLGKEESIIEANVSDTALFSNKLWLWAILCSIIALLGWFTFKMIRQEQ